MRLGPNKCFSGSYEYRLKYLLFPELPEVKESGDGLIVFAQRRGVITFEMCEGELGLSHGWGSMGKRFVDPLQVDNIGPSSTGLILISCWLLSSAFYPVGCWLNINRRLRMRGVRVCCCSLLSLGCQCRDNNLLCLHVSKSGFFFPFFLFLKGG